MDHYVMKENDIAENLKKLCDQNGQETDSKQAAQLLFKLGQTYSQRSPDNICLIKAAGLFNAAVVRSPSNAFEIKKELEGLCFKVLRFANAANLKADLIKKAVQVKEEIEGMRKRSRELIHSIQNVTHGVDLEEGTSNYKSTYVLQIKQVQEEISATFASIMVGIAQYCLEILGEPPCRFCIAGMGSLARKETTPYSDFEHIILLENEKSYENNLEYFRWFSVTFHIIILNLGETIIPNLDINSLRESPKTHKSWFYDSVTPHGISFDGMMPHACKFPLGRQMQTKAKPFVTELIKPIKEMLQFLTSESDRKNGYHLADILTKTCFVFGNKEVYEEFESGVKEHFDSQSIDMRKEDIKKQVKDDLYSFATRLKLNSSNTSSTLNVKQIVYRSSTLFVSALGRLHKCNSSSCFAIIENLAHQKIISTKTKENLMFAIAFACKIRLKLYLKTNKQQDYIVIPNDIEEFLELAGEKDVQSYFQIAYCLQAEICKHLSMTEPKLFYSHSELLNIAICHTFQMKDLLNRLLTDYSRLRRLVRDKPEFDFDSCIENLEQHIARCDLKQSLRKDSSTNFLKQFGYFILGYFLFELGRLEEAKDFFNFFHETRKTKKHKLTDEEKEICQDLLQQVENQFGTRAQVQDIDNNSKEFLLTYQKKISKIQEDDIYPKMLTISSACYFELNQEEKAFKNLKEVHEIYRNASSNPSQDENIAIVLSKLGACSRRLKKFRRALLFYQKARDIYRNISVDADQDNEVARMLNSIGWCHSNLEHFEKSMQFYEQSLEIYYKVVPNPLRNENIARLYDNIGWCLRKLKNYERSLDYFEKCIKIFEVLSKDVSTDENLAQIYNSTGLCLSDLNRFEESLNYHKKALEINQSNSPDGMRNPKIAEVLGYIGISLESLKKCESALRYHEQALRIYENLNHDSNQDDKIAEKHQDIGSCLGKLKRYQKSSLHFRQALKIYENMPSDAKANKRLVDVYGKIGLCYEKLMKFWEALDYYKNALKVTNKIPPNEFEVQFNADILFKVGSCYEKIKRHDLALKYFLNALGKTKATLFDVESNEKTAETHKHLGVCLFELKRYKKSIEQFKKAWRIYETLSMDLYPEKKFAFIFDKIGLCYKKMKDFEDSLFYHKKALHLYENVSRDVDSDENIASVNENIAFCFKALQQNKKSLKHFEKSIRIYKNVSSDQSRDKNIAQAYCNIAQCYLDLDQFENSRRHFIKALSIYETISFDVDKDKDIAAIHDNIAWCLLRTNQYEGSAFGYKKSLQIYENLSSSENQDENIARTYDRFGECLKNLMQYEQAFDCFFEALQLFQKLSKDEEKDEKIAETLENIADCFFKLNCFADSIKQYKKARRIYKNMSEEVKSNEKIAQISDKIGACFENSGQLNKALDYVKHFKFMKNHPQT